MAVVESVLFVSTSFPRFRGDLSGGFVFRIAKYLVRDGVRVTALVPGEARYATADKLEGVEVFRVPYFFPRNLERLTYQGRSMMSNISHRWQAKLQVPFLMVALAWAIARRQGGYDLVHCHWVPTAIAALSARRLGQHRPPVVLTNWGSDTRLLPTWLTAWTVRHVDGCISTAVETDEHLRALGRSEFRAIAAPVDEERFSPGSVEPDMMGELGIEPGVPVLAFVGRLDPFKDPITFIRACALLKRQGFSFVAPVAGDGELMAACRAKVECLGVGDRVLLLGMRKDPERLFRIATAAVHISPVENTWATAIAEAMFMDVPVVLTDAGFTERTFTHRRDCLVVPAGDPDALAAALRELIQDRALRARLVDGAWALMRTHRKDSISVVRAVRSYYDEVLARRQREKGSTQIEH